LKRTLDPTEFSLLQYHIGIKFFLKQAGERGQPSKQNAELHRMNSIKQGAEGV